MPGAGRPTELSRRSSRGAAARRGGQGAVADDDRRERVLLHARHRGAPGRRGHGGLGRRLCDRDRARQGASSASAVRSAAWRWLRRYGEWARRRLESGEQRSCAGVTVLHAEHASGDAPSLVGVAGRRRPLRLSQQPGDRGCESGLRLEVIRSRQQHGRKEVERVAPGRGFVSPGGQRRAGPRQHRVGQRRGGSGLRGPRGRRPGGSAVPGALAIARDEQPGEQRHEQRQPGARRTAICADRRASAARAPAASGSRRPGPRGARRGARMAACRNMPARLGDSGLCMNR